MSENQTSRKKFLQFLGLVAGSTIINPVSVAGFVDHENIKKLNPIQQEFMFRYGKWMEEFMEVVRIQKKDPANTEIRQRMIALTGVAEKFKPELNEFMKDETFSLIYKASIDRISKEIE